MEEVLDSIEPVCKEHPEYIPALQRLLEPERTITFRVRLCTVAHIV